MDNSSLSKVDGSADDHKLNSQSTNIDESKDQDVCNISVTEEQGSHASGDSYGTKSEISDDHKVSITKSILKQRKTVSFDLQRNSIALIEMYHF